MTTGLTFRPMTLDEFLPLVGTTMVADCTPREVPLTLVEASPSRAAPVNDRPPFILIFRSDPDSMLLDGIYPIRGNGFGPDLISISGMLAPRSGSPGYYYQAVFN